MPWIAEDKRDLKVVTSEEPLLCEAVRQQITALFERYETKRAALLPALHAIQHELGHIPPQAIVEVAQLLELSPAEVQDTISFYEEYFTETKGKKVVMVCRSLSCELMGSQAVIEAIKKKLGVHGNRETSADGDYTFMEVECLAACDKAPCAMIDGHLCQRLSPEQAQAALESGQDGSGAAQASQPSE